MKRILEPKLIAVTVICLLAIVAQAHGQAEPKCFTNDEDHRRSENETAKPEGAKEDVESSAPAAKFETVKFVLSFRDPPLKGMRLDPAYPKRVDSTDGNQTQAPAEDAHDLAKKLANPVASLISFPLQSNFDFGMGPAGDGVRYTLNIQPVIPVALNKDWNLISRTIFPVIAQDDVVGTSSQFGLGDTFQSLFFSPNKNEPFIWAIGPQFLIPTATDEALGTQKFGLGPTGLILKQSGNWTVGALVGHIWSVTGKSSRADLSLTNLQPFISYSTKTAWTFSANTESTYEWESKQWNVPIHFTVAKLVKFGKRPVSIGGALRCWTASAPDGPESCGFRVIVTPLFPTK